VLVSDGSTGQAGVVALTERQQAMLELERSVWHLDDPKDVAIRARFACAPDTYYAELNDLIDLPEALEFDPLVVRRLRRLRDRRRRARLDGTTLASERGQR
jgi:hypothetical protein